MKTLIIFSFVAFCSADMSVYIPDFDPQPISVNILGVGSDGRTTYEVLPGEPTGTWVGQDPAFVGTATLVEGPNDAVLNYDYPPMQISVVDSCNIVNGVATCTIDVMTTTVYDVEIATPILVQGGSASPMITGGSTMYWTAGVPVTSTITVNGSPSVETTVPTASPSAGGAVPGSGSSVGSAQTSVSSPAPTNTNGSTMTSPSVLMAVIGVIGISLGFM